MVDSLQNLVYKKLRALMHPSLQRFITPSMDLLSLEFLLEMNEHRTRKPNTVGRVSGYQDPYIQLSDNVHITSQLTPTERGDRLSGVLAGHTRFSDSTPEELCFRLDSYVHPEIWVSGSIPAILISHDGYTTDVVKVQGRTSTMGPSAKLFAQLQGWNLRFDDANNLSFWGKVVVPHEFRVMEPHHPAFVTKTSC